MRPYRLLVLLVVGFGLCERANGVEPGCEWWRALWHPLRQPGPCCPDDCCPKALPHVACPVSCCGPNDYCPKPLPITCPLKYCGVDDYCSKACAILLPSCYPPWYTCG